MDDRLCKYVQKKPTRKPLKIKATEKKRSSAVIIMINIKVTT